MKYYKLVHIQSTRYVQYYSLEEEQEDKSLFEKFLEQHNELHNKKLTHILSCIKEIGKRGAAIKSFRPEEAGGELKALPHKAYSRPPSFIENGEATPNNMRLYCHMLNESVVVLFGGGIKSENDPLECPNVREHFLNGNIFCNKIDQGFKDKDIRWNNEDAIDIEFEDFEIEIN